MSFSRKARQKWAVLALGALLMGCGSAGYAVDSATSACRQNPQYCALVAGEETVVPTALRGGAEVASVAATLRVLTPETRSSIEQALVECVEWAHSEVNRQRFGGKSPSREQCGEELPGADPCGKKVTRAMQLGTEKHALARQCVEQKLNARIPGRFSLDQRYRYDPRTGQKQLVSPEEARALRQRGCGDELEGTIVPDVVIHSGDPLEVLAVYDFKFPCPISNTPSWNRYPEGHPYSDSNQGAIYKKILGVGPHLVAPIWRIIRWVESLK
ncbi:hypothetical protein ATI61_12629 [Archangium gephyra]|uniref:Lipoprotein n=1 Tax=Archangium gephyra TaxID=48 RepID=A0AAC8QJD5_9BACT|nr:hypothetical protein [Archangium gephyra]AKJ08240.1 putative lipoprotein [Archangium gephyra]REG15353.1 hypothetical protein ATI61_12629 [Archangium gephyra]